MNIPMDLSPVEEEVEERGVVDGLDLGPGPVVPGPVPHRPLRLHRGRRGEGRGGDGGGERGPEAGAEAAREKHHRRRASWPERN